jgi:pimeloyl-ACP methyl ester carboxylesterase
MIGNRMVRTGTAATLAVLSALLAGPLLGNAAAQTVADPRFGDGGVSAFYSWSDAVSGPPGKLLRTEPLPAAQVLAQANGGLRILYTSTDGVGGKDPVVVSGAYFTPQGTPPAGGWPLIAWAHGTVGVADVCAPSWAGRSERDIHYLGTWLSQGYAIVATDYQGLGTPGPHPYLKTRPEAYSVLDSIRAVQGSQPDLSKKVVIVGQSQGGGAAFATAALAEAYAPEIDIRGTVATGTPYLSAKRLASASNSSQDRVDPTIAYVYYLTLAVQQTRPEVKATDVFSDTAAPLLEQARTLCIGAMEKAVVAAKLTRHDALKHEAEATIFGPLIPALTYATLKLKGPIFMGAGTADKDVSPTGQMALAADACAAGSIVEAHLYDGLTHSGTVNGSLKDSLPFVRKVLAGEPLTPRCTAEPQAP